MDEQSGDSEVVSGFMAYPNQDTAPLPGPALCLQSQDENGTAVYMFEMSDGSCQPHPVHTSNPQKLGGKRKTMVDLSECPLKATAVTPEQAKKLHDAAAKWVAEEIGEMKSENEKKELSIAYLNNMRKGGLGVVHILDEHKDKVAACIDGQPFVVMGKTPTKAIIFVQGMKNFSSRKVPPRSLQILTDFDRVETRAECSREEWQTILLPWKNLLQEMNPATMSSEEFGVIEKTGRLIVSTMFGPEVSLIAEQHLLGCGVAAQECKAIANRLCILTHCNALNNEDGWWSAFLSEFLLHKYITAIRNQLTDKLL